MDDNTREVKKQSWSERLFLRVNRLVGISPARDTFMYICAHWLIYIHAAAVVGWMAVALIAKERFHDWFVLTGSSLLVSLIVSYTIALLWRHNRPVVEQPKIKSLLKPLFVWKSFPSDHTIVVTVFTLAAWFFSPPLWLFALLLCSNVLVPAGRVYVGVHYPRDILGGLTIGMLCTMALQRLLL